MYRRVSFLTLVHSQIENVLSCKPNVGLHDALLIEMEDNNIICDKAASNDRLFSLSLFAVFYFLFLFCILKPDYHTDLSSTVLASSCPSFLSFNNIKAKTRRRSLQNTEGTKRWKERFTHLFHHLLCLS